jgi:K+-sensing histidine kinase KdpD
MGTPLSTPRRRYLLAALSSVVGLAINWLVGPHISISPPFITFWVAIMLTAWHAGLWPALLTTSLSIVFFAYCCMPPMVPFSATTPGDLATLVVFALQGMLTAYCVVYLQRARLTAVRAHEELEHVLAFSRLVLDEKDFGDMLRRMLATAMALLHADKGFIQLYDESTQSLSAVAQLGFNERF